MAKAKKAFIRSHIVQVRAFEYTCPHCKTICGQSDLEHCARVLCLNCRKEVILDWPYYAEHLFGESVDEIAPPLVWQEKIQAQKGS
jgi:hypothetical protein